MRNALTTMPTKDNAKEYVHYHKDGSVWAKGRRKKGIPTGYWEWFRKSGVKMRSGYFDNGVQTGEWTTFDSKGKVVRVTVFKAKAVKKGK